MPDLLNKLQHHWSVSSRREFFTQAGSGLAAIALGVYRLTRKPPRRLV